MTNQERDLLFKLINDDHSVIPIAHQLFRLKHFKTFANFFIKNRIVGKELGVFYFKNFEGSFLSMVNHVALKINRSGKEYKLINGVNYNVNREI